MSIRFMCKRANPTLFDELIHMYDINNETNAYTKSMSAKQLYIYRWKNRPNGFYANIDLTQVFKTIYERDFLKEMNKNGINKIIL
jgi:hypothetical protein